MRRIVMMGVMVGVVTLTGLPVCAAAVAEASPPDVIVIDSPSVSIEVGANGELKIRRELPTRKTIRSFVKTLDKIVRDGVKSGKVTRRELMQWRILRWFRPLAVVDLHDRCLREGVLCGAIPLQDDGTVLRNIDWDKFKEFLKEILPLILEFIKALVEIFAWVPIDTTPACTILAHHCHSPPLQLAA